MATAVTSSSETLRDLSPQPHATQTQPKNFFIFGQDTSHSISPTIHCAAFKHYNLPHSFEIVQAATVDELSSLISSPSFGGASVTMPHNLQVSKLSDSVSDDARTIGAINTLIVEDGEDGEDKEWRKGVRVIGENTDWNGLVACLKSTEERVVETAKTSLVIGAGGASKHALYSLYRLGVSNIFLINQTTEIAAEIDEGFSLLQKIVVLSSLSELEAEGIELDVIIGTIPTEKTNTQDFRQQLFVKERELR